VIVNVKDWPPGIMVRELAPNQAEGGWVVHSVEDG
jgi:hypothetical protein